MLFRSVSQSRYPEIDREVMNVVEGWERDENQTIELDEDPEELLPVIEEVDIVD